MCTVTYIPLGKSDFILTSNRDETPLRKTISPQTYVEDGVALTYPKDAVAGGTWIGLSEKKRLICLLNGGFRIHKRAESYKMSRGIIVKKLLKADDAVAVIEDFDFENIEPFTIVLVDWKDDELKAYELVWTGEEKHFQLLKDEPKIWSSSTLYTEEMKALRQEWFQEWLDETAVISQEKIVMFHQDETKGHSEISLKMKRKTVETVSVTSIHREDGKLNSQYLDFVNENIVN